MSTDERRDKGVMTISLLGREFRVGCPEGEEKQLQASVDYLNRKLKEVRDTGKPAAGVRVSFIRVDGIETTPDTITGIEGFSSWMVASTRTAAVATSGASATSHGVAAGTHARRFQSHGDRASTVVAVFRQVRRAPPRSPRPATAPGAPRRRTTAGGMTKAPDRHTVKGLRARGGG